jgi:hypothetical protein
MRAGFRRDLEAPSGMLAEVPRIVRASLLFPYAAGFDLAERTYRAGGRPAIDRMLLDPPLSALRVRREDAVHDVEFIRLPAGRARQLAGEDCRAGHHNVAGVVGIEALFTDHGAAEAAAALEESWSGDRFLHLRCPDGDELFWITRWRTAEAASAFSASYGRISGSIARSARLAGEPIARPLGTTAIVATPDLIGSASELLRAAEIRRYPDMGAWVRDDCFPESPCPQARAGGSG